MFFINNLIIFFMANIPEVGKWMEWHKLSDGSWRWNVWCDGVWMW